MFKSTMTLKSCYELALVLVLMACGATHKHKDLLRKPQYFSGNIALRGGFEGSKKRVRVFTGSRFEPRTKPRSYGPDSGKTAHGPFSIPNELELADKLITRLKRRLEHHRIPSEADNAQIPDQKTAM